MNPMLRNIIQVTEGLMGRTVNITLRGNPQSVKGKIIAFEPASQFMVLSDKGGSDPNWVNLMEIASFQLIGDFDATVKKTTTDEMD